MNLIRHTIKVPGLLTFELTLNLGQSIDDAIDCFIR